MSSIGEYFPSNIRAELAANNLKPGAVIRIPVDDTIPPKIKFLVLISKDSTELCFATIFINSEINMNVLNTNELQNLQIELKKEECPYLDNDSYADCSKLSERNVDEVTKFIEKYPSAHKGQLSEAQFECVISNIKTASTITNKLRKKYGLI